MSTGLTVVLEQVGAITGTSSLACLPKHSEPKNCHRYSGVETSACNLRGGLQIADDPRGLMESRVAQVYIDRLEEEEDKDKVRPVLDGLIQKYKDDVGDDFAL